MSKKILTTIIFFIILIVIIVLFMLFKYLLNNDSSKKLELTYEINAGIPFRWEYEIEDESIVKFDKKYVINDENKNGLVGGKVATNYVFKGLKKGTTTITFKYVNFITNEVHKKEKLTVRVDNNLNISLVGIPSE